MSEKKRGRPRKIEVSVWDKKYYRLSNERDNRAHRLVKEERMLKAFDYIHQMAFDKPLGWFDINPAKNRISDILDRI